MKDEGLRWSRFALAVFLSVAAYHLGITRGLVLLPIQWVFVRGGKQPFLWAAVLSVAGIVAGEWLLKQGEHTAWNTVDAVSMALVATIYAGWVSIVLLESTGWRFLYRLLAVTAATGLVWMLVLGSLLAQPSFVTQLGTSFAAHWEQVSKAARMLGTVPWDTMDKKLFFDLLKEVFLTTFVVLYFLLWAFTGRLARVFSPREGQKSLKDFFVPPRGAAILLGLWGLILLQGLLGAKGMKWDWGFVQYAVVNAAWVSLIVYILAGWGIVNALLDRWRLPPLAQAAVRASLIVLPLVIAPLQLLVLVGLPVLAVMELWVNFRNRTEGVGL